MWRRRADLHAEGMNTVRFAREDLAALQFQPGDYLYIDAVANGEPLPRTTFFPEGWRGFAWPEPGVRASIIAEDRCGEEWLTSVRVTAQAYARLLFLVAPETQGGLWWSDNYFDLCGGRSRLLTLRGRKRLDPDQLRLGHWLTEWL